MPLWLGLLPCSIKQAHTEACQGARGVAVCRMSDTVAVSEFTMIIVLQIQSLRCPSDLLFWHHFPLKSKDFPGIGTLAPSGDGISRFKLR